MGLELYTPSLEDCELLTEFQFDGWSDTITSKVMYTVPATEKNKAVAAKQQYDSWNKDPNFYRLIAKDSDTGEWISYTDYMIIPEQKGDDWNVFKPFEVNSEWNKEWFLNHAKITFQHRVNSMGNKPYVCKFRVS
jgi:hypothetical protein